MFKKILILGAFLVSSCSTTPTLESPVIYFSNASQSPIKNIRCNWVENTSLTLSELIPGDSRSQSFYMRKAANFFGLVKVTWTNDSGDNVTREFYFRENNMPSIKDHSTYSYAQIYFDQNDLEVISSDAPDLSGKTVKMDRILASYKSHYKLGISNPNQTSLIRIEPIKDRSVPGWLNNSF
jgi:hypothetical protein